MTNLKRLNLNRNSISFISSNIKLLYNLEELYLDNNELVQFTELCYIQNIKILNLNSNNIDYIPYQISNLTKLEILLLNSIKIIKICPEIYKINNLKFIL